MSIQYKVLGRGFIDLQDIMGNDLAIVNAARVSYLSESKGEEADKKLLFYLLRNDHTSPFEMCELKFMVKAPLFVARQWMRHRTWSFNEVSRRYTSDNIEFFFPEEFRKQDTKNKQGSIYDDAFFSSTFQYGTRFEVQDLCMVALEIYNRMIDGGIAREQARMVLPQNMYTSFIAKTDLHNLLHFCRLRTHPHAQFEIREYANIILHQIIKNKFPWTYEAYMEKYQ